MNLIAVDGIFSMRYVETQTEVHGTTNVNLVQVELLLGGIRNL